MVLKNPITQEQYDAWVAALESGDYKKGRGRLVRTFPEERVFCCLGVLGDLLQVESTCRADLKAGRQFYGVGVNAQTRLQNINDVTYSWDPVVATLKSMSLEELHT